FGLLVNGRDSGMVYGAQQEPGWTWQDGGVHELSGAVGLTLHDKTGQFGRCSSVILTRDLNYTPRVDVEAFKKERARLTGVSDRIRRGKAYDVIVVGAGPAGGCAAIAAARMGAKTALISDRPVLGGNASVEIGVPVQGAAKKHHGKPVRETGIIEEAGRIELAEGAEKALGREARHFTVSRPFEQMANAEPRLDVFENSWLEDARKEGAQIREVILRDTLTGERTVLSGKMFIDCSGDAWMGYHAGADERVGREARSEFNEAEAPDQADGITMSGCLRGASKDCCRNFFYTTAKAATPQPFNPPPWLYDFPEVGWENGRGTGERLLGIAQHGTWWLEHTGDIDDLWNPEFARDELIRVNYAFWSHMKNKWPGRDQLANYSMEYIPFMVGKREGRRLMGDYVMNANDALEGRTFKDAIGHTGWSLDVHAPKGILSTIGPNGANLKIPIGEIPYRCLYSRNVDNLLMAGRCASATHEALGTVRIEASCAVTGQAAGTAAALALLHKTTPRGVYEKHLDELQQQLLKDDQHVPGVPNRDPADLARDAEVRASSMRTSAMAGHMVQKERWLPLSKWHRGEFFRWEAGKQLQSVKLYLEAAADRDVTLHVREAQDGNDLSAAKDVATITRKFSAGAKEWVEFPVNAVVSSPYAWLYLEAVDEVQWCSGAPVRFGSFRIYKGKAPSWTTVEVSSMVLQLNPEPGGAVKWQPANVVNGVARPTLDGKANCWESDPGRALPQWIELTLKRPSKVGAIHCVFDTDLTESLPTQRRDPFPAACVRDYTLECFVNGAWQQVVRTCGNFQRFRRHQFTQITTDKIRLTVEATHGAPTASVFEIRVYADGAPALMG
ncbi:MAG: FAD-dependent oxidoreductase, partial [Kiritimatiellales bacterium]|nr:FAD-dependent oxidoreductase [Kiritimatiellales bacterium]